MGIWQNRKGGGREMKNKEFYRDEIFEIACEHDKVAVVDGKLVCCMEENVCCEDCGFFKLGSSCDETFFEWLDQEHKELKIQPEVKKLKKDDRVLVSNDGDYWVKRHFKKYDPEKDVAYAYEYGLTSWTTYDDNDVVGWTYAKLPEEEKEVDWSKIPVDTKIFVKNNKDSRWFRRHFAKYENGKVYAWGNEYTSDQTDDCAWWSYAKLAEDKG